MGYSTRSLGSGSVQYSEGKAIVHFGSEFKPEKKWDDDNDAYDYGMDCD